jgi:hypothetical protein
MQQGNTHLHSRFYRPRSTYVYVRVRPSVRTLVVQHYEHTMVPMVLEDVRTYTCTYVLVMVCHNFLIGKGHTCALRTTCVFGRIHGSQLREGANAGQHTPTLSLLPPSHHCLDGEYVRTYVLHVVRVHVYHMVPWYTLRTVCTMVRTRVRTYVRTYRCTRVRTRVRTLEYGPYSIGTRVQI